MNENESGNIQEQSDIDALDEIMILRRRFTNVVGNSVISRIEKNEGRMSKEDKSDVRLLSEVMKHTDEQVIAKARLRNDEQTTSGVEVALGVITAIAERKATVAKEKRTRQIKLDPDEREFTKSPGEDMINPPALDVTMFKQK